MSRLVPSVKFVIWSQMKILHGHSTNSFLAMAPVGSGTKDINISRSYHAGCSQDSYVFIVTAIAEWGDHHFCLSRSHYIVPSECNQLQGMSKPGCYIPQVNVNTRARDQQYRGDPRSPSMFHVPGMCRLWTWALPSIDLPGLAIIV